MPDFSQNGRLTMLALHQTEISGAMPLLPEALRGLTLYGCRLSCGFKRQRLPELRHELSLPGNN